MTRPNPDEMTCPACGAWLRAVGYTLDYRLTLVCDQCDTTVRTHYYNPKVFTYATNVAQEGLE